MTNNTLPMHGKISCRRCWIGKEDLSEFVSDDRRFKLVNDPGAWGSENPEILVLGISKGNTQSIAMTDGDFDAVAFKNIRSNIQKIFDAVGINTAGRSIDDLMRLHERDFAWGSLSRCSLTGWDKKKHDYTAESGKVLPAFKDQQMKRVITNCVNQYLSGLPDRVRLIVLLGNSEQYMTLVQDQVRNLYPDSFQAPEEYGGVAYKADGKWWVHVGHPSRGNGYLGEFLRGSPGSKQGNKRELAKAAIQVALGGAQ